MEMRDRLLALADKLGMAWGADGQVDRAAEAALALVEKATGNPVDALRLAQVLLIDRDAAVARDSAPVAWVRDVLRAHSETLGGGDTLVGWCCLIAFAALGELIESDPDSPTAFTIGALRGPLATRPLDARWAEITRMLVRSAAVAWSSRSGETEDDDEKTERSLAESIGSAKDPETIKPALKNLHLGLSAQKERGNRLEVLVKLLWWSEAGWSPELGVAWDEISEPARRALVVIDSFVQDAPENDSATSFLLRVLQANGIDLAERRTLREWAAASRDAWTWMKDNGVPESPVPERLGDVIRADVAGLSATAARLGLPVLDEQVIPARAWYLAVAREQLLAKTIESE